MPKYKVTIEETTRYEIEVEAGAPDEAESRAEGLLLDSGGRENYPCTIIDREVLQTVEKE